MPDNVTLVEHPLVRHKLSLCREVGTPMAQFRQLLREISLLLCYEVTRDLPLVNRQVTTPLATVSAPVLKGEQPCFVAILRAGIGLLDGMLDLMPAARVGHIGLYRDPETLVAVEYYCKVPDLSNRLTIVVDPMLATGNSAVAAVQRLKENDAKDMRFVCLLAAPEGIANFTGAHPDVPIFTAAIDQKLDDHGYIVPGLGDAGDRLFGTQ